MKNKLLRNLSCCLPVLLIMIAAGCGVQSTTGKEIHSVVATGAELVKCADGFKFSEGPASDTAGNVYFSDYRGDELPAVAGYGRRTRGFPGDREGPQKASAHQGHEHNSVNRPGDARAYLHLVNPAGRSSLI